jgi:hypothetical protein
MCPRRDGKGTCWKCHQEGGAQIISVADEMKMGKLCATSHCPQKGCFVRGKHGIYC